MTVSTIKLLATQDDHRLAMLAALGIALALAESVVPTPLPGIKPGIANIVTLVVLYRYGWQAAVWVSLLRVVASSLLLGSFLSPGFVLGFSGAAASLMVLVPAAKLPPRWFGPVSLSVLAAFAHIFAQLAVAYLWFIPHAGILLLAPIFSVAALLFGSVNGWAVSSILSNGASTPARMSTS